MRSLLKPNFLILITLFFSLFLDAFASPVAPVFPNEVASAKNQSFEYDNAIPSTTRKNLVARETYPDEAECSNAITNPPRDKSLFFSKLPSNKIILDFRRKGYKVVNQVYPTTFFQVGGDTKDPEYRAFIDRTSRIFAERSSGTVTVLLGEEAPCTTWTRVEFPALKSNDQVEEVVSVDPRDTSSRNVIYNKGQPTKRQGLPPWDGGECLDFDDPSWLTQ